MDEKGYEPPVRYEPLVGYKPSKLENLSYLPPEMMDVVDEFSLVELYIPFISNLTCTYKVTPLGIFLSERHVVQALINHFTLLSYKYDIQQPLLRTYSTIDEIINHIETLFNSNIVLFRVHVKRYVVDLKINPHTNQYQLKIPVMLDYFSGFNHQSYELREDMKNYRDYWTDHLYNISDYNTYNSKLMPDIYAIYVLLKYDNYIPNDRLEYGYQFFAGNGSRETRLVGIYSSEDEIVKELIYDYVIEIATCLKNQHIEDLYEYMGEDPNRYENDIDAHRDEIVELVTSYYLSFNEINDMIKSSGTNGAFVVYKYHIDVPNHMLDLPCDFTDKDYEIWT